MRKFLLGALITLGSILVVALLVLGYLGFIPGLSSVFGADKPRNLGVTYTAADYDSAHRKSGIQLSSLPDTGKSEGSIVMTGKQPLTSTFSSAEITAAANERKWKYWPISKVQVKFNSDGSMESSGVLNIGKLVSYAQALGLAQADIKQALDALKSIPTNPAFYVKLKTTVTDNKVSMDVQQAELGRLSLTPDIIKNAQGKVIDAFNAYLASSPNISIKSLSFADGKVNFDGTLPAAEATVNR